eukprot:29584-Pelagococcus_subviridis.AAC.7
MNEAEAGERRARRTAAHAVQQTLLVLVRVHRARQRSLRRGPVQRVRGLFDVLQRRRGQVEARVSRRVDAAVEPDPRGRRGRRPDDRAAGSRGRAREETESTAARRRRLRSSPGLSTECTSTRATTAVPGCRNATGSTRLFPRCAGSSPSSSGRPCTDRTGDASAALRVEGPYEATNVGVELKGVRRRS